MGQLIHGSWTNAEAAVPTQGGVFARPASGLQQQGGARWPFSAAGRALPSLCLARLPLGAPHAHLSPA